MMSSWGQRVSVTVPRAASTQGQAPPGLCPDALGVHPCHEAGLTLGLVPPHWVPRALASSRPSSAKPMPQAPGAHPGWHRLLEPKHGLDQWRPGAHGSLCSLEPLPFHSYLLAHPLPPKLPIVQLFLPSP